MLTMLVVDDEIYALKGITQGIDWSDLPIGSILEAENADQAKAKLREAKVDLVISDIEMPGVNGIELLRHIREVSPDSLTIFLTGHARFEYAQEALQYGCYDYVLKPIDHDVLKEIVRRAAGEIERKQERQRFEETLETYRRHWTNQLPILVERFWQNVLSGRVPAAGLERLAREFEMYGIPLTAGGRVLPVLLSIEQWDAEMDARDERIMEYAVRKAAEEIVLGQRQGAVLQDRNDMNLVLVYLTDGVPFDREAVKAACAEYVRACGGYFHCRVSCYVGGVVRIGEIAEAVERLSQLERANVSRPQTVIDGLEAGENVAAGGGPGLPSLLEWGILLDNGSQDELVAEIAATMRRFQDEAAGRETLELFYYGFVHLLFQAAHRRGLSVYDALAAQEIADGQSARTPQAMQAWAAKTALKLGQAMQDRPRDASAVIAKIQAFIQDNLHKELGRDDIAAAVYRNPAYLSRMFRKETGLSLTDYIAQIKIERAKRLLVETNDKVSNIAEGLGYLHFSYFAKLFKKMTGITPQEYRKKHQTIV
ncbi:response regulator [Cohnella sp. CFH 77786]|uniref:response regulator n=1 Tax=Cohnella sp. CFH 77786 TaxID=2662265 RepID=UPI001C60C489|nr:response regulator [Cohnella sp. CFH 77786]MBW5445749.1 response regulator [Cohnella sp. CFH 77786]